MYDGVFLQNNYNIGTGYNVYQLGAGVFIRTNGDLFSRQSEFIMKGGTIRGNTNSTQNSYPNGGGVLIIGFGIFNMKGGIIMNNKSQRQGGGFNTQVSGSLKKTGGIIYGADAPLGYRNIAAEGGDYPKIYGHAVNVQYTIHGSLRYRDDTIAENDNLSYLGSPTEVGTFGIGEKWNRPGSAVFNSILIVSIIGALVLIITAAVYFWKRAGKKQSGIRTPIEGVIDPGVNLTPREKEVFNLLMSSLTAKQIAKSMQLSISSINFHSQNIYRKLGIQSRAELLVKYK